MEKQLIGSINFLLQFRNAKIPDFPYKFPSFKEYKNYGYGKDLIFSSRLFIG